MAKIKSEKISQSTKYGQISEEFFPLEQSYPYNSQNFKFLGDPIDGIQFNENEIILIEFKTNKSQLSQKQRIIRDLVKNKKVSFELIEAKL
ncbi:MAG: Holliday junction resolvase-like protein [Dehalococcoidia bacterium]